MALLKAAALFALIAITTGQGFDDYDYQDLQPSRPVRPQPTRTQTGRVFSAPTTPRPAPVAILKQINRHNDDGSYTYGYEGADGSFKIETKLVTGEVMGKYGYVDENGKQKVVEYGANRYGFQPSGEGITVPPPTLVDETTRRGPNGEIIEYINDGSYYDAEPAPRPAARPAGRAKAGGPRPRPQPQPIFDQVYEEPRSQPQQSPAPVPPRASIPGAAPTPIRSGSGPVPPRVAAVPGAFPAEPIFRSSAPSQPVFRPAPQQSLPSRPAPVREHRPAQRGLLDDLAQQYSLPQNGRSQLVSDISFGSYSSQTHF